MRNGCILLPTFCTFLFKVFLNPWCIDDYNHRAACFLKQNCAQFFPEVSLKKRVQFLKGALNPTFTVVKNGLRQMKFAKMEQ